MKSNPPTYAPDISEKKLALKEQTIIKFKNRSRASGIPVATLMKAVLDDAVAKDPWTVDDENALHDAIIKNMARNEKIKARAAAKK